MEVYQAHGGFSALHKAVTTFSPEQVILEVKNAGLRGRGGAGFPTGIKWGLLSEDLWPHYVVANADESEPGTFKDREILESNPFQFLEGLALACYAVQANLAYIYLRGEVWEIAQALDRKLSQMKDAGFLGDRLLGTDFSLHIHTHLGAGAYICGEETALLESLEGRLGQPRLRPPFPASCGLYGKPTVINNVETLTNVPVIVDHGSAWYRSLGTARSPGPKIFCLSGHVNRPGNYEVPLGTPLRKLIYDLGGGIPGGRKIKAILPAGASSKIIAVTDEEVLDTPLEYESLAGLGSGLGSASIIVVDETVDMDWLLKKTVQFFGHELCGKCTPCRVGNRIILDILQKMDCGEGEPDDMHILRRAAETMDRASLCGLGQATANTVLSTTKFFLSRQP